MEKEPYLSEFVADKTRFEKEIRDMINDRIRVLRSKYKIGVYSVDVEMLDLTDVQGRSSIVNEVNIDLDI
jgi:hypothetical protein